MGTSSNSGGNGSGKVVKPTDVTYRGFQAAYDVFNRELFGPKSSPTIERLLANDPAIEFAADAAGRWRITERATGTVHGSPMDEDPDALADVAYLGRLPFDEHRSLLLIAGVHAMGSLGAVDNLVTHLPELHRQTGTGHFSMAIACQFTPDATITSSDVACGPLLH